VLDFAHGRMQTETKDQRSTGTGSSGRARRERKKHVEYLAQYRNHCGIDERLTGRMFVGAEEIVSVLAMMRCAKIRGDAGSFESVVSLHKRRHRGAPQKEPWPWECVSDGIPGRIARTVRAMVCRVIEWRNDRAAPSSAIDRLNQQLATSR